MTTVELRVVLHLPDGVQVGDITLVPVTTAASRLPITQRPTGPSGKRLGDLQLSILRVLGDRPDGISDPGGRASARLYERVNTTSTFDSVKTTMAKLDELGLIERQIKGKRCYRIGLTAAGWKAVGKEPPARSAGSARPGPRRAAGARKAAAVKPPVPPMPQPGPIGKRRFDPDQVREDQGHAGEEPGL